MRIDVINQSSVYIDEITKINLQVQQTTTQSNDTERQIKNAGLSSFQSENQKSDIMDKNLLKDPEELKKLMKELETKLSYLNSQLKIEINDEINQPVVKIMDINTNQVIRQIPPDYMINIIKNINKLLGVLFEEKA